MQKLTINPAYAGKVVTKDLGYTTQRIEVDKLKPSQYERVYKMGFTEIFLKDGETETATASNTETENTRGTSGNVEQVQEVEKKPRKKRTRA